MKVTSLSVVCGHVKLTTSKVPPDFLIEVGVWSGRQGITALLTADEALELSSMLARKAADMMRAEKHRVWREAHIAELARQQAAAMGGRR
jgi:hypothetical protein